MGQSHLCISVAMVSSQLIPVLSLVLVPVLSLPAYPKEVPSSPGINYDKPAHKGMPYNYNWAVADTDAGLNYGQEENSDGSVVTGEYRVLLPDGRTQIVRYKKTFLQYFRTFIC